MNIANTKYFIEITGFIAVVLSLLFVGYELRLARSVAESEDFSATIEVQRNMAEFIASNAGVWTRGCMAEELTSAEQAVFSNIAISLITLRFGYWSRAQIGITDSVTPIAHRQLAESLYNFEGLRTFWGDGRNSPLAFRRAVNEEYEQLVEKGAERNLDVALCGN